MSLSMQGQHGGRHEPRGYAVLAPSGSDENDEDDIQIEDDVEEDIVVVGGARGQPGTNRARRAGRPPETTTATTTTTTTTRATGGATEASVATAAGPSSVVTEVDNTAEEVMREAAGNLPPEPEGGTGCRIALRLPDGRRVQRRFDPTQRAGILLLWCKSEVEEAATGRPFTIKEARPGSKPLDPTTPLGDAKVDGAMLVLSWSD